MSDGPHYSLSSRPKWKKAAEVADNAASSREEVRDAASDAIIRDCRLEKLPEAVEAVKVALMNDQVGLFERNDADRLDPLIERFAGYDLSCRTLEFVQDAMRDGSSMHDALEVGIESAMVERIDREVRSMEEHYLRESHRYRAAHLGTRMDQAIEDIPIQAIAREFVYPSSANRKRRHKKKTEIDDGVQL